MPDVAFENHGALWLLRPVTGPADEWTQENVLFEPCQWASGGIAVDHRYVLPIVEAMRADGFQVEEVHWTNPRWGDRT